MTIQASLAALPIIVNAPMIRTFLIADACASREVAIKPVAVPLPPALVVAATSQASTVQVAWAENATRPVPITRPVSVETAARIPSRVTFFPALVMAVTVPIAPVLLLNRPTLTPRFRNSPVKPKPTWLRPNLRHRRKPVPFSPLPLRPELQLQLSRAVNWSSSLVLVIPIMRHDPI